MNDRIHSWLDGELPLEALAPEERQRAFRIHSWLRAAEDATGDIHETSAPRIADRVMNTIPAVPPPSTASAWDRLLAGLRRGFSPRPVPLPHAVAAAAFALLVGIGLGVWGAPGSISGADDSGAAAVAALGEDAGQAAGPRIFVRFEVRAEAETVHLAGSFSGWEPAYELSSAGAGLWTATVPLEPGVHDYVFIVDGEEHLLDPSAPRIADGFGGFSSRLALLTSAT